MAKIRMSRKPQKQHQTRSADHSRFKNKAHVLELIYILLYDLLQSESFLQTALLHQILVFSHLQNPTLTPAYTDRLIRMKIFLKATLVPSFTVKMSVVHSVCA